MALTGLTQEEQKLLIISIGTHRGTRALSPVETAALLRKAVDNGASLSDCAAAVQLEGTSSVSRFLALLKLPPDLQHLIAWGQSAGAIGFTSAFELSRLDDDADQRKAASAILENNLSSAEVRQLVQARQRSGKRMDECVGTVLKMRPQVQVRHVFIGSILDPTVRARLKALSQQQRDEALQRVLRGTLKQLCAAGRLGVERFTLVGGAEMGVALKTAKDDLEKHVNTELRRGVGP